MNFAGLLFLLVAHFFSGRGVLRLFKLPLNTIPGLCFSVMLGVPLLSFAPCVLQLLAIPITMESVLISVAVFTLVCSIPLVINFKRPVFPEIVVPVFYEWPFLAVFLLLSAYSVWRCFYFPPYSKDMLSGPELLAKYAVEEKTMISSVFNIDLSFGNNYFKSPYITCLQIIYKLLVQPFGQLWLSVLFIPFTIWVYTLLRTLLHPVLAGILMLFFITIPELFSYTFLILYDYSNMVFFFSGFYFLIRYIDSKQLNEFIFSAFLFGIATYIRTETLVLVYMLVPMLAFYLFKSRLSFKGAVYRLLLFVIIPFAFYFLCINVFVRKFVPLPFDLASQINPDIRDVSFLFHRLRDMASQLIFSDKGIVNFGYYIFLFLAVLLADLVWLRHFNRVTLMLLYGIVIVYLGLGLIGYIVPIANLTSTTKRGLFKLLPLMLLYMANSSTVQYLSDLIMKWEYTQPKMQEMDRDLQ